MKRSRAAYHGIRLHITRENESDFDCIHCFCENKSPANFYDRAILIGVRQCSICTRKGSYKSQRWAC